MSYPYIFVPTQDNMKLDNGNIGHDKIIGIILCCFTNLPIIYPVVTVYLFLGHPYNTISPGDLNCYVGF